MRNPEYKVIARDVIAGIETVKIEFQAFQFFDAVRFEGFHRFILYAPTAFRFKQRLVRRVTGKSFGD